MSAYNSPFAAFVAEMAKLNVVLPLTIAPDDQATLVDAAGRDVLTVDVNGQRSDTEAFNIASQIHTAINTCGAFLATQEPQVAIETLKWIPVIADGRDIQAQTEFGAYTISVDSSFAGGTHYLWTPDQREYDDDHHSEHRGMTAARATAQADYEARAAAAALIIAEIERLDRILPAPANGGKHG